MSERDLFGHAEPGHYPDQPGYRRAPTSREAARVIASRAGTLRRSVLDEYRRIYPAARAADEIAAALDTTILSVRPRCTELRRAGLLEVTTERHKNESGMAAHRLRASRRALQGEGA